MKKYTEGIALGVVKSFYAISNGLIGLFRNMLFARGAMPGDAKNILIYRVGNIGDIICAVASMRAVRKKFNKAKISLLSSPGTPGAVGASELLTGAEFLDDIIIYHRKDIKGLKGKLRFINSLRMKKFDIFIELPMDLTNIFVELRNLFFAKIIGARKAFGFHISTIRVFTRVQSKYLKFCNETERLLEILKKEGLDVKDIESELTRSPEDKKVIDNFLSSLKGKRLVVFNPNAKRKANLWPMDRFAEVGRWLIKSCDAQILIIGGTHDYDRAEGLKESIGEGATNAAGGFTILQTLEIIKRSQLLISNDTGAVHMAASVGTPVIGIYAAWQIRGKWFPEGSDNIILREEPRCHACYCVECSHRICLEAIGAEKVCAAAEEIFRRI
ncbi:MAG: glycosyltransferase family 9 protein [Candidatus Omnitrophota bacterium]